MSHRHPTVATSFDSAPLREQALALGLHVAACMRARGRWVTLCCLGEQLYRFVALRLCTTVVAAAALVALLMLGPNGM